MARKWIACKVCGRRFPDVDGKIPYHLADAGLGVTSLKNCAGRTDWFQPAEQEQHS